MNKLKKIIAVMLTAAMFATVVPVLAEENNDAESLTALPQAAEQTTQANDEPLEDDVAEEEFIEDEQLNVDETDESLDQKVQQEQDLNTEPADEIIDFTSVTFADAIDSESYYPYTEEPVAEGEYKPNTYAYPIQGDPYNTKQVKQGKEYSSGNKKLNDAYWLRDSDFFGEWDEQNQKWTKVSKLNYEEYPDLSRVEEAAKSGDYELAKLAYYNYYVEKEKTLNRNKSTSSSKSDRVTADLLCKNFMYNANSGITVLDFMNVGNTPSYNSIDISSIISKYVGIRQYVVFWVLATDKNGDWAEFDSKEGENKPYIQMVVDGAPQTIYPTADTHIKAGENKGVNYGSEDKLVAREDDIDTIGPAYQSSVQGNTHVLMNGNTSRIYMKFDISSLKAGDNIDAATLNLFGNNQVDGQTKEVVVFYSDDSSWEEDAITYNSATAQVIYSYDQLDSWYWNQPIDAGYRYQEELLRFNTWFDKLVKLYNFSGDEKYAYTAIRQFIDYINVRGDDICWLKSLDVAVRTQCMPGLWMQLLDSKFMSPEVFTTFMKWCYVQGTGAKYFTRTGNWGTSETLGLYTLVINYPEFTDSSDWLEVVRRRYESLSDELVKSDYVCTELALGYTDYTLETLVTARTVAMEIGMFTDEFSPYTQKTMDNIEHLGLFMYWSSMPGVRDNQVGDGYSHRGNFKSRLETLGNWFGNEQLLYAATDGDAGEKPDFTSKLFPVGLKVVMRTGWDESDMYLFSDADGGIGNHAHPDDNSVVVWANGQYLLIDPLYGTYSASEAKTWLTSSIAHNLVVVNGGNQKTGTAGTIPRWETNDLYDFSTTSTKSEPDTSVYKRSVFFLRSGFFLVNDYLEPSSANASKSNKYVQAWHYLPEAGITMDEETKTVATNFTGSNIQVVPIGADKFTRAENVMGLYSESQGSVSDALYTEYQKDGMGTMTFNTLLLPQKAGEDFEVISNEIQIDDMTEADASAYEIYITEKNTGKTTRYQYYLLHNEAKKGTVTIDNFTTDASMMFVEMDQNGNVNYIALQDATVLNKGSKTIFKTDTEYKEFAADLSGELMTVSSSVISAASLKTNNVKLYTGNRKISEIMVNGEKNSAVQNGEYVYFGTVPADDPNVTPSPSPVPTKAPAVHGGGGGGGSYVPPVTVPTAEPTPSSSPDPGETDNPVMNDEMKAELENHWAKNEVETLYNQGIVTGQTSTSLGLENSITRAEFVTLLVRAQGLDAKEYVYGTFNDVNSSDWYSGYIQAAYDAGIFKGSDNNANPNANITREEMAKMLAAVIDEDESYDEAVFSDASQISDWAKDSVNKVVGYGLMNGRGNGEFAPKESTKRCEAFVVIYRLLYN